MFRQPALSSLNVPASKTKYIYYLAVRCIRAPLAGFPLLGRMQEITRGERKEENKIGVSSSVCQPVGAARLMVAKRKRASNQYTSLLIKQAG